MPRHAVVCAGFGKYVGGFGGWARARALPSRIHAHTRTHIHTRACTQNIYSHIRIHASAYTIACFVPRNFVRHARCRMLCALPVTRILNTEFNFFLLPAEWSFAIFAFVKYAIIGSHSDRIEFARSIF